MRMVVLRRTVDGFQEQRRVHIGHRRQRPVRAVAAEPVEPVADPDVPQPPQRQERQIVVVVRVRDTGAGEAVPDGRQRGEADAVVGAVGLRGVQVDPVRERRAERGRVVVVADRPRRRGVTKEGEIRLDVVADRWTVRRSRAASPHTRRCCTPPGRPSTSGPDPGVRSPGTSGGGTSGAGHRSGPGTRARPDARWRPAASRGCGRTTGSPCTARRSGRCRRSPGRAGSPVPWRYGWPAPHSPHRPTAGVRRRRHRRGRHRAAGTDVGLSTCPESWTAQSAR